MAEVILSAASAGTPPAGYSIVTLTDISFGEPSATATVAESSYISVSISPPPAQDASIRSDAIAEINAFVFIIIQVYGNYLNSRGFPGFDAKTEEAPHRQSLFSSLISTSSRLLLPISHSQ